MVTNIKNNQLIKGFPKNAFKAYLPSFFCELRPRVDEFLKLETFNWPHKVENEVKSRNVSISPVFRAQLLVKTLQNYINCSALLRTKNTKHAPKIPNTKMVHRPYKNFDRQDISKRYSKDTIVRFFGHQVAQTFPEYP